MTDSDQEDDMPTPTSFAAWCVFGCAGLLALLGTPMPWVLIATLLAAMLIIGHRAVEREASGEDAQEQIGRSEATIARGRSEKAQPVEKITNGNRINASSFEDVRRMTDEELCHAWRASYVRLRQLQSIVDGDLAAARVAAERARYLDELEQRNPRGFGAWIAAGARAPSDPTRYLNGRNLPRQDRGH